MTSGRYNITAAPQEAYSWLVSKTGCALTSDFNAIQATDEAGHIRGMVGYCSWSKNSVLLHMAASSPIVWRSLLRPALEYPFVQVGVDICLGIIPASNKRSVRFTSAVGFEEVHRIRDGWARGEDLLMLELRRANCSFILSDERRAA